MSSRHFAAGLLLLALGATASAAERCAARSTATITPLVELYTSEGCSSCPPADRWLSAQLPAAQANWLAFHVDYWDAIGWPDRFAAPLYTQRQRARVARAQGSGAIYTPQVMVGADVHAPWRAPGRFERVLALARQPAAVALALQLGSSGKTWDIRLGAARAVGASATGAEVWLAQYLDDQVSRIEAGENRGVTLHHDRVVRRLWGPWPLGTETLARALSLEVEGGATAWGLTAFVQDAHGTILQSLDLPSAACQADTGPSRRGGQPL